MKKHSNVSTGLERPRTETLHGKITQGTSEPKPSTKKDPRTEGLHINFNYPDFLKESDHKEATIAHEHPVDSTRFTGPIERSSEVRPGASVFGRIDAFRREGLNEKPISHIPGPLSGDSSIGLSAGFTEKWKTSFPLEAVNSPQCSSHLREVSHYMHFDAPMQGWDMKEITPPVWGDVTKKPWMQPAVIENQYQGLPELSKKLNQTMQDSGSKTGASLWTTDGNKEAKISLDGGNIFISPKQASEVLAEIYWSKGPVEMYNRLAPSQEGIVYSDFSKSDGSSVLRDRMRGYDLAKAAISTFVFEYENAKSKVGKGKRTQAPEVFYPYDTLEGKRSVFQR